MRKLIVAVCAFALAVSCRASLDQVTTLSTSTAKTILIAAPSTHLIMFQNLGANAVNVTVDGGTVYTDPSSQKTGMDPTTGATGLGLVIPPLANGVPGSLTIYSAKPWAPIRAIMQTSTTTLNIITDGYGDVFPTT
jgi:hypothetical protein